MKNNLTVAVCGGSWVAGDLNYPGCSFGEILADKYNYNLLSLARGGCGNFSIGLQVDKAIELQADIVIISPSFPDTIEIPIIKTNKTLWEKLKKTFDWNSWFHTQPSVYKKERGLANIKYSPHFSLSSKHEFLHDPTIISESLNNLVFHCNSSAFYEDVLTQDQVEALKMYMTNLYDSEIKRQNDVWIINDACRRLQSSNIPFLLFVENLYKDAFFVDTMWLPDANIVSGEDFSFYDLPAGDTVFHYSPLGAGETAADYVQKRLTTLLKQIDA